MNCLPNQISHQARGSDPTVVVLLTTETTPLKDIGQGPDPTIPTLEVEMTRRATMMTDLLTDIMNRPISPRFWGLNE